MADKTDTAEVLVEDEKGHTWWWAQCRRSGCQNLVTHDSNIYCYPHSRWYRKYKVYWNGFITFLENKLGL